MAKKPLTLLEKTRKLLIRRRNFLDGKLKIVEADRSKYTSERDEIVSLLNCVTAHINYLDKELQQKLLRSFKETRKDVAELLELYKHVQNPQATPHEEI